MFLHILNDEETAHSRKISEISAISKARMCISEPSATRMCSIHSEREYSSCVSSFEDYASGCSALNQADGAPRCGACLYTLCLLQAGAQTGSKAGLPSGSLRRPVPPLPAKCVKER